MNFRWFKYIRAKKEVLFLLLVAFSGCEEPIDWQLSEGNLDTIVVDAIITNDKDSHVVKISKPVRELNRQPDPVTGADVAIRVANTIYHFTESSTEPGTYIYETPISNAIGTTLYLQIVSLGDRYEAEATMMPVNVFGHMTFSRMADTDSMRIDQAPAFFNEFEQAMYEINIDWSHLVDTGKTSIKVFYYTFNTIDVGQIFSPEKESIQFPAGSRVIVRKHSLSPEYAEFLRALVAETQWQGSLFVENKDNLPSNISNGGLGFFSACAVLADTLVAE